MSKWEQDEITSDNQISSYTVDMLSYLIKYLKSQEIGREFGADDNS